MRDLREMQDAGEIDQQTIDDTLAAYFEGFENKASNVIAYIKNAKAKDVSYETFLVRLLRAQWHHRQETALAWRIKRARLPEQWTLESFPFKKQSGVSRRQIRGLAELDFVAVLEPCLLFGAAVDPGAVGAPEVLHEEVLSV